MLTALFRTFFHIGLFTIGGGYAMIPLIEAKVVEEKQWISREELLDLMAVAQSCPGIFAVNISIFIGNKLRGTLGALMATLGCIPAWLPWLEPISSWSILLTTVPSAPCSHTQPVRLVAIPGLPSESAVFELGACGSGWLSRGSGAECGA